MAEGIYVKMYVDAVRGGLVADMGADNWQTLCVLASFMDEKGECYPSQMQIAKCLGVSRETAARRVKRLTEYRRNGECVVEKKRERNGKGRWENVRYRIKPESFLEIFGSSHVTHSQVWNEPTTADVTLRRTIN